LHPTSNAIDFKKHFGTSISCGAIRKIRKNCYEASVIEDQIRERSGRPKNTRTNENIALLRAVQHPCAAKGGLFIG